MPSEGGPGTRSGKSLVRRNAEVAELLQRRLALSGRVLFTLSLGFYLALNGFRSATSDFGPIDWLVAQGSGYHLAATLLWGVVALVTSTDRIWPPALLEVIDAAAVIVTCLMFAAMGYYIHDPGASGAHASLLAVTNVVIARAVLLPSDARRTFFVTAAATLPVVATAYLCFASAGPTAQMFSTVTTLLWCLVPTALATVASAILWGLRQEVREARTLGQYTLQQKIGEGGMGAVYRAKHAMLRRPTAVKLLAGANIGERELARFEREVQLTALLTHPNTISVFDYGRTPDGVFYYAMEFLDGLPLEKLVELDGPQPAGRAIHILRQVCGALAEAHGIGLIHRDIKPENIVLCERGGKPDVVKVLDFGLVKTLDSSEIAAVSQSALDVVSGTPQYLAPEAILAPDKVDARSDLYALGAVGYFLLTGTHVFEGRTLIEVCSHHLHTPPQRPSERLRERTSDPSVTVPPDLEDVIMECLSKEQSARPASALALDQALATCADDGAWSEAEAREFWATFNAGKASEPSERPRSASQFPRLDVDMRDRKSGMFAAGKKK